MECNVCKSRQKAFIYRNIITSDLARSWSLRIDEIKGFNLRESSNCQQCGSSLRSRSLAQAIVLSYPESKTKYFVDWIEWAKLSKLKIAEVNYCGQLHSYLARVPGNKTSQYRETTLRARITNWAKGIRSEDITNLSYRSNCFDLVLHSEVLEHVDDINSALTECKRILKPGGICLFTVPLIISRKTKRKARIDHKTNVIKYYGKPSYHGNGEKDNLVFWEFGGDFVRNYNLKIVLARPSEYVWVMKLEKCP